MCIFCEIIKGAIPSTRVYEDDKIMAFRDIAAVAPTHIVVIPKKHIESLSTATAEDAEILGEIQVLIAEIARREGLDSGYRVVLNCGEDGGQTVKHIHYHLIGGKMLGWPPYTENAKKALH